MSAIPGYVFTWDGSASVAGGVVVDNADWAFDDSVPGFWVWRSNTVISGGGSLAFGAVGTFTPTAVATIPTILNLDGSINGGDTDTSNNSDVEVVNIN